MAKLTWDESGKRLYETGVDHVVLYVKGADGTYEDGVAWNGVTAITESPSGAEPTALYADNIKYLNLLSVEEFAATIEAYNRPLEFMPCDGAVGPSNGTTVPVGGIILGQQKRSHFGLCYRTLIGSDTLGNAKGYKIHVIFDCLAAPSEKAYEAINDSPDAITFSWEISTTSVGYTSDDVTKYTANLIVDSTKFTTTTQKARLKRFEDTLYGTDPGTGTTGTDPTLLELDDLIEILTTDPTT